MKGYFMYGIVVSYETYINTNSGKNTIEEMMINTNDVQGIFTGRGADFVIVGTVLKEVDPETQDPHEVPVMTRTGESMVANQIEEKFGISGEAHYYYITR